jgi:hypothetical protein
LGDDAPLADGSQLGDGCRLGHRRVAVTDAELESYHIGAPRGLTRLALSEECLHEQAGFIVQLVYREIVEDHSLATTRPCAEQNNAPDHLRIFRAKLLRDHAAQRKAHGPTISER